MARTAPSKGGMNPRKKIDIGLILISSVIVIRDFLLAAMIWRILKNLELRRGT